MAKQQENTRLYSNPAVRPPLVEDLKEICKSFGIRRSDGDLQQLKEHIDGYLQNFEMVDKMVEPTLPVKYPRVPGYKPEPDENRHNAWYWKCDIAGAADGLLAGKRVAIKDSICVAGVPMLNGSRLLEKYIPDIDATVVTRILDAGGRVTGKANCEHLCTDVSSWSNDTGPILNPHDPRRSAGGSSGGSAVVVQTGDADMSLGGDQGGSIRIPASWCGVVGLKPTWGLVPCTGAAGFDMSIDHVGPMAKTVADCALLLECIAGFEDNDPRMSPQLTVPKYSQLIKGDVSDMKVGMVTEGFCHCDEAVQKVVRDAATALTRSGALVEEVSLPQHEDGQALWSVICNESIFHSIAKGTGDYYNFRGYYPTGMMEQLRTGFLTKANNLSDTNVFCVLAGEYIYKNYGTKFYAKAQNVKQRLTQAYNKTLDTYDVLVMPTAPYTAPLLPTADSTVKERLNNAWVEEGILFKNTGTFDLTGHPALTVPAGTLGGLPVGIMIVGRHFDEVTVFQVARAVERLNEA